MNKKIGFKLDESGYLSQEDTKRYYSRIGLFCFILAAVAFLVSFGVSLLISSLFPQILDNAILTSLINYGISFLAIYCIATPLSTLALKPLPKARPVKEKLGFGKFICALCIAFTFMEVGMYVSNILIMLAQNLTGGSITNPVSESLDTGNLLINALCMGILFPILEELLFRKILCNRLIPLGERTTVVLSAAIFGLIHGNLYQFVYAFLVGLLFAYVYVKTGKLIYTIILHCILNLYAGVFASIVASKVRIDEIYEIIMSETYFTNPQASMEQLMPYAGELALYMLYAYILMGLSIAGFVILLIKVIKKKITFEQGILPAAREKRLSNFFLTGGVAASIGFFAFKFIFSILY